MSETQTPAQTRNRQMSFTVLDNGDVHIEFGKDIDPIIVNVPSLPESLYPQAATKGFIANWSGATAKLTGENRTGENLRKAVLARIELNQSGQWGAPRGEGGGEEEISMEAEAAHVFRVKRGEKPGATAYTGTLDESVAAFAALSDDQVKKLKETPLYKLAYAEVKQARNAAKLAKMQAKAMESSEIDGF